MKRRLVLFLSYLFIGISLAIAQSREVKGTVTSTEDGQPVIGASVVVKGTSIGTITDANGNFLLKNVPQSAKTIFVSYIGMKTKEAKVEPVMKIKLSPDSEMLDEIVVTAMGVTRSQKSLGYASASIKGDKIAQSQAVNPMSALQGKVAGVDISNSPGPGTTQNVIIRGASSFSANQPLYIVDGVPITNEQNRAGNALNSQVDFGSGINAINPDDIADMTILKGAAATALYGSRAANGVIMITTKSGKNTNGKIRVNYDGALTLSVVGRLPQEQQLFGQGWASNRALEENGNWGARFDGKNRVWGRIVDDEQLVKPYQYYKNHMRDFYEVGKSYKNAVSLSGGNAHTTYFVSLSHNSVNGVIPTDHDSYKRYTISTRGSHKGKRLSVETSVNFSYEKNRAVPSGQGTSTVRSLNEIANDIYIPWLKDYKNKFNNLNNYFTPYGLNPYYVLNSDAAEQGKTKIFGKLQLDYAILPSLKLTYRFGGDLENTIADTHTAKVEFSKGAPNDGASVSNVGKYEQQRRQRVQLNHDFMIQFNDKLGEHFHLNAIAGLNTNERYYNWLSGFIDDIDIPGYYNLVNSANPAKAAQRTFERRLVGIYANADLSFNDYLYLTLTARNDWSSTLPQKNNSYFYPGATVSFLLTDMLQQKGISTGILDFAKLRVAYGMTGNDTDMYNIYNRYVLASIRNPGYPKIDNLTFPINAVNSYSVSDKLGNNELKPEQTTEIEFGFETRFFKHRLGLEVSFYDRYTKNLIEILPKDPSTGFTSKTSNLGDVRNRGFELTLTGTPIKTKNFSWDVALNWSINKNKVERLDVPEVFLSGLNGAGIYAVEGQPLGQFKMNRAKKTVINGKEHVVVDGEGFIQPTSSPEFLGKDIHNKYRMGLTNTLKWKGITAYATLDFRYGGYIYSQTKQYLQWTGSAINTIANERRPFVIENSVQEDGRGGYVENTIPVDPTKLHTFYSNKGGLIGQDAPVISRSFLKLREVGVAYQLPQKWCTKLHLTNARVSLTMNNFLLWTPKENTFIDPETTTFGNDIEAKFGEFNANPTNETYAFGLSFGF